MAESRLVVYGAIAANLAIAVTKFVAATVTGSSAMLSEGIHSIVDTGNGVLLLVGMKLSQRQATPEHPFGHGKEMYFWSLMVAVLIFGLGGGISAYEGVLHMLNPLPLQDPTWNYVVLGAAAVFESGSFMIALRQFLRTNRGIPFWRSLKSSKDPTTYTVLAEDAAALAGLAVAAAGVYLSHRLDMPIVDGAASVVIGVMLAGVAVLLIRESRGLLIGEGVRAETASAIRDIALQNPHVRAAAAPLSMYLGPDEVLLTLDVGFERESTADDIVAAVASIERNIKSRYPKITRIYIEARSISEATRGS
ncbi:MAG: cation diffusion facilitator family transporter [Steroidobacteraceae bacterium]|nr:cation diffusion facilitator family transporter [Steroidobacteraceae bacterium]